MMTKDDAALMPMAKAMIAAFPLPSLAVRPDGMIAFLNAGAETLLGKNLTGRHFTTTLRHPKLVDAVERCAFDRAERRVSFQILENGADALFDVQLQAVEGTDLLLLCFHNAVDIAQAEQMRRDFVANVSHELRTPLTALMGFIETLRTSARDDAKARDRFLDIMTNEAERMNRLVGDLLSLSRVEAEERVRPTTCLDLRDVLRRVAHNMAPLAQDSNVTLRTDPGAGPLLVMGDADQLMQVFTNLVENAIKYGGKDQAVDIIGVKRAHDSVLRRPVVEIQVADHGPGIQAIHLSRLTERFYRADNHRSRALGGTGLGLAIVKHIVNRHRGRLKITSQLGQGSQFTIILPDGSSEK